MLRILQLTDINKYNVCKARWDQNTAMTSKCSLLKPAFLYVTEGRIHRDFPFQVWSRSFLHAMQMNLRRTTLSSFELPWQKLHLHALTDQFGRNWAKLRLCNNRRMSYYRCNELSKPFIVQFHIQISIYNRTNYSWCLSRLVHELLLPLFKYSRVALTFNSSAAHNLTN